MIRWPSLDGDLARPQRHLAPVAERGGRGQGHGDDDHAEVDHHAAVGPSHEAPPGARSRGGGRRGPPAPAGGRWPTAANPPRPKASNGTEAPHAADDARRPRPGTPTRPGTMQARSATSPRVVLRHGSAGPTAMRNEQRQADGQRHGVEVGRAHRDLLAARRPRTGAGRPCPAARRRRTCTNSRLLRRKAPLATDGRVDAPRGAQPVAAPGDQADAGHRHHAEEAEQRAARCRSRRRRARTAITPERVRKVPRMVRLKVAMTSDRFQTRSSPRRSWTITECR